MTGIDSSERVTVSIYHTSARARFLAFSKEEIEELARLMMNLNNGYDEEVLTGCIRRVRLKALQKEYKEHSMLADALSRAKDPRFIEELKICQDLQQEMRKWSV